ncbi:para-aminobenzoate synthetase/4-amino-4-deoxychorismate lyase [Undibacterium sp. GrIS 1.8]|uniref:aminodeoxychorismate synthase component I n=1 Tax=unclassified Undibacterium TaxID=2630295 RepID=UPI00339540CA
MSFLPNTTPDCFALLDDAHAENGLASSRLYTGLVQVLQCDAENAANTIQAAWQDLWQRTQQALQSGMHAVALLSYETGARLQAIDDWSAVANPAQHTNRDAVSRVLLFTRCDLLNREQVAIWLADAERKNQASVNLPADADKATASIAGIRASVDEAAFTLAISQIRAYIAAGDTYQVNYTYRLHFDVLGSPLTLYRRLRQRQPVPYGALICLPDGEAVLSLSPELFVRHQAGELFARPMKGTAAATGDAVTDARLAQELAADPKNRAENLMIVDLLRNDLGRIAVPGSVKVPALFEVNRFSSVLQMTSSITATLQPELGLAAILSALFPCGSITGAPKHRTMQIVREVETEPRGLYTGAIGWFDPPETSNSANVSAAREVGDFCLSVPIRTLILQAPELEKEADVRQAVMGVGAGIVYDSVAAEEFAECQLKAKFLTDLRPEFALFETMHASREHGYRHLPRHLQRLRNSAQYLGFAYDEEKIVQVILGFQADLPPEAAFRLRLTLQSDGTTSLQSAPLLAFADASKPVKLVLATQHTQSGDVFLRHKTTQRQQYDQAWQAAEQQGAFDALFCNQYGYLTEGGRSNLFVQIDGKWFTPPLSDGVLPGVMRAVMLDDSQWQASEKQLRMDDLRHADQVMVCNSLRGAMLAEVIW